MKPRVLLVLLLCLGVIALSPLVGPAVGDPDGPGGYIFWQLRVPRALVAVLVGGMLSITGAGYQTIFGNPLAAPSTVGTTAGATLGALFAVVAGGSAVVGGLPIVALAAFVGALAASFGVAAVAASGRARVNDILLAGIAVSLAAGAAASGLQYSADQGAMFAAVQWSLGHLPQVGYRGVLMLLPFVLPCALLLLTQTRALQALLGGEQRAHSQGVDVARVRTMVLALGALGVAACVAWCGPIAFVGLIVPHIVRMSLGVSRRVMMPMSFIVGAAFLAVCDTFARTVIPGRELPVGVVTAAVGAPMLVWLVVRSRR